MGMKEESNIPSNFIEFFIESMPKLLEGAGNTLLLTFISIIVGLMLGVLLALGKIYGNKIITGICIGYIEIIRGTPLLVQLFILYFGLPRLGLTLSPKYNPLKMLSFLKHCAFPSLHGQMSLFIC